MSKIEEKKSKSSVRQRADMIKDFRCKNLIAVLECPTDIQEHRVGNSECKRFGRREGICCRSAPLIAGRLARTARAGDNLETFCLGQQVDPR